MFKAYITNLGRYNEGYLEGKWVEFPIDEEDFQEVLKEIGINQHYEEWFITDYMDNETPINLSKEFGEYASYEDLEEFAEEMKRLDSYDMEKLQAYYELTGDDFEDCLRYYEDSEFYEGYTLDDLAYMLVEECYNLPEFALRYFDYERFARDLSFDGFYETSNGVIRRY